MTGPAQVAARDVKPGDHVWIQGYLRLASDVRTHGNATTITHGAGISMMPPTTMLDRYEEPDRVEVGKRREARNAEVREQIAQRVAMEVIEQSAGIAPGATEVSDYGIALVAARRAIAAYRGEK